MRVGGLWVALLLLGCQHDFSRPEADFHGYEDDARVDLPLPDAPPVSPLLGDLGVCPSSKPDHGATSGNCGDIDAWTCLPDCEGQFRMACFSGKDLLREIRCGSTGTCACIVGAGTPAACSGLPETGRTGCLRCREAFLHGCCVPE